MGHYQPHFVYILKEIEIIKAGLIILGLSFDEELIGEIFGQLKWVQSGYSEKLARSGNSKIVSFYHSSARNAAPASYSLLQNAIRSEAFASL